ncbi:MAG: hypothetical protein LC643_09230, partial [Bacteroidales bacterium]|nr:hypothetical protein [Bacteroidales bacterium]
VKPSLFISKNHYEKLKAHSGVPQTGDLLMPSICPDGRIHVVVNDNPFYFKDGRVLWIKVEGTKVNSLYLRAFLKQLFHSNYSDIASGTTFAELKIVALKRILLLAPPLDLQDKFGSRIENVSKQVLLAKTNIESAEDLFNGLLQKAFKGELVNSDISEPLKALSSHA